MPCGKEKIERFDDIENQEIAAIALKQRLKRRTWSGFAEVDIEIPERLWPKFEEMCPFFHNKQIPSESVPKHMLDYLAKTGRKKTDAKRLVGALSAKKILLYAPLLRWYIDHGAEIRAVLTTIDYKPAKIFPWFVEQVTEARRTGDVEKDKASWQQRVRKND